MLVYTEILKLASKFVLLIFITYLAYSILLVNIFPVPLRTKQSFGRHQRTDLGKRTVGSMLGQIAICKTKITIITFFYSLRIEIITIKC